MATSFTFTTLDDPSAAGGTFAQGINDSGQVVGYYVNSGNHAFTYNAGVFSDYSTSNPEPKTSTFTTATAEGINNSDEVVGSGTDVVYSGYVPPPPGQAVEVLYVWNTGYMANISGSPWSAVDQQSSYAYGINSANDVVGYFTENGVSTGFLDANGTWQTLSYSGATDTYAHGINDQGQIVGYFIGSDPNQPGVSTAHGFLYNGGAFSYFDDPNAVNGTYAEGINNLDEIVGYYVDGNAITHGFIFNLSTGIYTTVDVPGARNTFITGINNNNELAGYYVDGSGTTHGFVAAPPTPPNPAPPAGTTADMIMNNPGNGDYEIYNIGGNQILAAYSLGQVGSPWSPVGLGTFQAGDTSDMLLRNSSTGQFEAYYISNNNITNAADVGTVGSDWNFAGTGDFDGQSSLSELLLRNADSGAFELYQVAGGGVLSGSSVGAVGGNFTVEGFGHFSESSTTQMLMQGNSGTSAGQLELYTYNSSGTAFAGIDVGKVGSNLAFLGCADLLGNGSTQMVMQQNNGDLWLYTYDPGSNALSGTEVGAVGGNFHVVGFGPFGSAGKDEMLMQNGAGDFEVYQYNASENAFDGTAMGAVGSPWTIDGIAANSATSGSTAQLVQGMASMSNGLSISTSANLPAGLETTLPALLATPQHA